MDLKDLERAFASTGAVLGGMTSAQLDESTPCASWTVRDLVNHIVGGTAYFAAMAETGQPPEGGEDLPDAAAAADRVARYNQGAALAVEAFSADGAMDRVMHLPFGDLPGSVFVNIAAIDTFTHGWDLAKATGQPTDLDPALATEMLGVAQAFLPDEMRGPEPAPFGPRAEAPAGGAGRRSAGRLLGAPALKRVRAVGSPGPVPPRRSVVARKPRSRATPPKRRSSGSVRRRRAQRRRVQRRRGRARPLLPLSVR